MKKGYKITRVQVPRVSMMKKKLISMALQKPRTLGLPYALWTLERLQTAFEEREGIHLSDSTI